VLQRLANLACFVCAAAIIVVAQTPQNSTPPDLNTIVARMMAAQHRNKMQARPITIKRDYQLLDKQQEQKAQVVANITYLPPDQKQYRIESSQGGLGQKILRDVLDKETEQPKDPERKELSTQNYNFQYLGTDSINGSNCYVLGLNPRRDDKELIRGRVWIDAGTYNIRRVEGNPAKNPSWWIRDLHLLMSFDEVNGMWLRTFTYAIANVRFKGRYEMVARDLEYSSAPQRVVHRRSHPEIVTGAAFNP